MISQTEYTASGAGLSQCDRILAALEAAHGKEVSMVELAHAGSDAPGGWCMVHSRIADLRKRGHDIPAARLEKVGRQMHSFYKLIPNLEVA